MANGNVRSRKSRNELNFGQQRGEANVWRPIHVIVVTVRTSCVNACAINYRGATYIIYISNCTSFVFIQCMRTGRNVEWAHSSIHFGKWNSRILLWQIDRIFFHCFRIHSSFNPSGVRYKRYSRYFRCISKTLAITCPQNNLIQIFAETDCLKTVFNERFMSMFLISAHFLDHNKIE